MFRLRCVLAALIACTMGIMLTPQQVKAYDTFLVAQRLPTVSIDPFTPNLRAPMADDCGDNCICNGECKCSYTGECREKNKNARIICNGDTCYRVGFPAPDPTPDDETLFPVMKAIKATKKLPAATLATYTKRASTPADYVGCSSGQCSTNGQCAAGVTQVAKGAVACRAGGPVRWLFRRGHERRCSRRGGC